jgi:hypothetical protein
MRARTAHADFLSYDTFVANGKPVTDGELRGPRRAGVSLDGLTTELVFGSHVVVLR